MPSSTIAWNKILAAVAVLAATSVADAGNTKVVTGVKAHQRGADTRVEISMTGEPVFTAYKLSHPDRVIVDIAGVSASRALSRRGDGKSVWTPNTWEVSQVQAHGRKNGRNRSLRVEVSLARAGTYKAFARGNKLVIEVAAFALRPETARSADVDAKVRELEGTRREMAAQLKALKRERAKARLVTARAEKTQSEANRALAKAVTARDESEQLSERADSRVRDALKKVREAKREAGLAKANAKREVARAKVLSTAAKQTLTDANDHRRSAAELLRVARKRTASATRAERGAAKLAAAAKSERRRAEKAQAAAKNARKRNHKDATALEQEAELARTRAEKRVRESVTATKDAEQRRKSAEKMAETALLKKREALAMAEKATRERAVAEARKKEAERAARLARTTRAVAERDAKLAEKRAAELGKAADAARAEVTHATRMKASQQRALASVTKSISEAEIKRRRAVEATEKAEATLAELRAATAKVSARHAEARKVADRLAVAQRKGASKGAKAFVKLEKELAGLKISHARAVRELATKRARASRDQADLEKFSRDTKQARSQLVAVRHDVTAARDAVSRAKQQWAELRSKRDELAAELKHGSKKKTKLDRATVAAAAELRVARGQRTAAERAQQAAEKQLTSLRGQIRTAVDLRTAEQSRLSKMRSQRDQLAKDVAKLERKRTIAQVSDIDFRQAARADRVVVKANAGIAPQVVSNSGTRAVLRIPNTVLPRSLEKTLDTSAFGGVVKSVSSYQDERSGDVRVVVELARPAKAVLRRKGNTYYWDFPRKNVAKTASVHRSRAYPPSVVSGYTAATAPVTQATVSKYGKRRSYSGKRISLDIKDADLHNLMRLFATLGDVNIVIPDEVRAKITVRLQQVPWDQAMEVILASKGLWYRRQGRLIRIATRKELDTEDKAAAAKRKLLVQSEAPEAEIFTLNYAVASRMRTKLSPLLSPKGRIETDERTNSLIINDVRANRRRILALVQRLDTQTPQIQIEARIVEARSTFQREFGIQWGGNAAASAATGNATGLIFPNAIALAGGADDGQTNDSGVAAAPTNFAVNLPAAVGTGSGGALGLSLGSVGGNFNLNLRLSALEDKGTVRIISAPKITTLNNIAAKISQGVSIPISVISASGVNTQFVQADLSLQVTPHVSQRDCSIAMEVKVTKNEADFANTGARGDPSILRKEAQTTVLVADGETTVIGGIYTRNSGRSYSKVPFLGDLPVIGYLFKNRREGDERTEVLIFLTPKITNRAFLRCE